MAFGWTENVNLHTSSSVSSGSSATDDIDLDNAGPYDMVAITIEIAFGGSPDGDVTVEIFGSTDSGTNDDTIAIIAASISEATSTTKRATYIVENLPYIAVTVTNNDSTDAVTYDSWYAGRTPS